MKQTKCGRVFTLSNTLIQKHTFSLLEALSFDATIYILTFLKT